jgi:ribokinase
MGPIVHEVRCDAGPQDGVRSTAGERSSVLVACLGDVVLDVIVETRDGLVPDDDTPARITFAAGGQAANVATWVVALGGEARLFGPRADTGAGHLVEEALRTRGVDVRGSATGRTAAVVSLVSGGTRSMASDPGDLGWLDQVRHGSWLEGADWLFVSGYALLRTPDPQRVVETAAVARAHGTRIAVDLSSAAMIAEFGAHAFAALCAALRPAVVLGTDAEWGVGDGSFGAGASAVRVHKHGSRGATFASADETDARVPVPGPVVDTTGAGDALAAGYLVGGPALAMDAAARCVAGRGAQPAAVA